MDPVPGGKGEPLTEGAQLFKICQIHKNMELHGSIQTHNTSTLHYKKEKHTHIGIDHLLKRHQNLFNLMSSSI